MTEYDYWKIFPRMPKKVTIGDITIRDGFQHCEKFHYRSACGTENAGRLPFVGFH